MQSGSILDAHCDAVVSPANSFGFMDGGIDALYSSYFGWHAQDRFEKIDFGSPSWRTLRWHSGGRRNRSRGHPLLDCRADNACAHDTWAGNCESYLATRAVLLLVSHGKFQAGREEGKSIRDHIQTVAFPGLGTGVGRVPFAVCARQVRAAIEECSSGRFSLPKTWLEASERHQLLYTDRPRDLQH